MAQPSARRNKQPRAWVLLSQAIAIVLWTTVATVSVWAALTFLVDI